VPVIEGWARTETIARRIAARLLPSIRPAELPPVILAPSPPRYRLERPRCGAKTRKGTPCQAAGIGRGGRCKFHGGMSTGARTPEGRQRQALARAKWARAKRLADTTREFGNEASSTIEARCEIETAGASWPR
jgi:hypothetical protein